MTQDILAVIVKVFGSTKYLYIGLGEQWYMKIIGEETTAVVA